MEYIIILGIIFIYSSMNAIILKRKIDETIPLSIVEIILVVYIAGLFDNLKIGVKIVEILSVAQLCILLILICKAKDRVELIKMAKKIITPGLIVYILLCFISIYVNKGRIFLDSDEFNHWGKIIKNMFLYNTYGTNVESIVIFNEYPPLTAIFQYLFLSAKNVYSEDVIITAHNIMYFSIIIPVMKNINWDKGIKKIILIVPNIILLPMIFFKDFYLNILVDGLIAVIFAITIYYAFENENTVYKYIKIFTNILMLCLIKTNGILLAVLAILIIIIKQVIDRKKNIKNFKKEIFNILVGVLGIILITSSWYIKVKDVEKRWDFSQYIKTDNKEDKDIKNIAQIFTKAIFNKQNITEKNLTVITVTLLIICSNLYMLKKVKNNNYKYYSNVMMIIIPIYMIMLGITYMTIFDTSEAQSLLCFDRYSSVILLANMMFQMIVICNISEQIRTKEIIIILFILISLLPQTNIEEKYIHKKTFIANAKINRTSLTMISKYKNYLSNDDKILFIALTEGSLETLTLINEYEIMPIKIEKTINGNIPSKDYLETIIKNENYNYVFVYSMESESKEKIKDLFNYGRVQNDTLYKVTRDEETIYIEKIEKFKK